MRKRSLLLWARAKLSGLVFILRDLFTVTEGAPMASPHTCTPTGALTLVQTNAQFSTSGGEFIIPVQSVLDATGAGSCWYSAAQTRTTGLATAMKLQDASTAGTIFYGWFNNTPAVANASTALRFFTGAVIVSPASADLTSSTYSINTYYQFCHILTTFGGMSFVKMGTNWEMVAVKWNEAATTFYAGGMQISATAGRNGKGDDMRILQAAGPFSQDYGAALVRVASPAAGTTGTTTADAHTIMTVDTGNRACYVLCYGTTISARNINSAGVFASSISYASATFNQTATGIKVLASSASVIDLAVRYTDDNNCWIIREDKTGGTQKIIEKNGGTETERASVAATLGTLGISGLTSWPRIATGSVAAELNRITA